MFIYFDRNHERDGHTDGRTDRQTDRHRWRHRPHLHSIARQKWSLAAKHRRMTITAYPQIATARNFWGGGQMFPPTPSRTPQQNGKEAGHYSDGRYSDWAFQCHTPRTTLSQDVCLSVTRWYSIETAKYIIILFSTVGSRTVLVFSTLNGVAILRQRPS